MNESPSKPELLNQLAQDESKKLQDLAQNVKDRLKELKDSKEELIEDGRFDRSAIEKNTEHKYKELVQKGKGKDRDVYKTGKWYLGALILVGATEWLINYESFYSKFGVPAFAAGLTVIVALIIAYGGHEVGTFWKQPELRNAWKKGHSSYVGPGARYRFAFTLAGLIAALVIVGWNRYTYLSDTQGILLGQSVWPSVTYTVLANVIVFIFGCLFAYAAHSPGIYDGRLKILDRKKKKYESQEKKLMKETRRLIAVRMEEAAPENENLEQGRVYELIEGALHPEAFLEIFCKGDKERPPNKCLEEWRNYREELVRSKEG